MSRHVEAYGPDPQQVGEWFVPGGEGPLPTVVLVHGGFWREGYDRHLEDDLAEDLAGRGYLCWNIDYRPSTTPWPTTFTDVAAAYDAMSNGRFGPRVDRRRVAVVGHSAGGHLAAWLGSRHRLPAGAAGSSPDLLLPALVVPQAGVVALTLAARQRLGDGAPQALLDGAPREVPDRYRTADPVDLVPTGVTSRLIHGRADDVVPVEQSRAYVAAAVAAGDDSRLDLVSGDHFVHLRPGSDACDVLRRHLAEMATGSGSG